MEKENGLAKAIMTCHNCNGRVATYQSAEATPYTIILSSVVCLVFWFWSLCLLPFVIPLTKAVVTRCTRCDEKLHALKPLGMEILKDEVVTLTFGKCAIVVSRMYLLAIFTVITCGILGYWFMTWPVAAPKVFIRNTWPEYVRDCGSDVFLRNNVAASTAFLSTYAGKTVTWEGYMMKINEQHNWLFAGEHAVIVLVKMKPSESDIHADLILSMNK